MGDTDLLVANQIFFVSDVYIFPATGLASALQSCVSVGVIIHASEE